MSYEREGLLLPLPTQKPIDAIHQASYSLVDVDGRPTYKELTLPTDVQASAREAWKRGENPDLRATHLDSAQLDARVRELQSWKQELVSRSAETEVGRDVDQLYRWRINEDIANIQMLRASQDGDMRQFRRLNEFVYGKPDEDIYRAALDWVAHDAETLLAVPDQHPAVVEAAHTVVAMLDSKRGYRELLAPDAETFEAVRTEHWRPMGYYGLILAGVEVPEGKVTPEIGDPILLHILRDKLQTSYELTDSSSATWSVSNATREYQRPPLYNMPHRRFVGLTVGHEPSHIIEHVNGLRGPVSLAAAGLDRYEAGNEGRAVLREEVAFETFDEFGKQLRWRDILRRHIAISFASGVAENAPQPSAAVYDFMHTIDLMYQARLKPDNPELAQANADKKTSTLLLRVLKGTDGTGGAYLKDKVYLEGHVASWLTAAQRGPEAISEGDLGKFDISNPRHIKCLRRIGLLPAEAFTEEAA